MMLLTLKLLLAHFIGDFVLQPNSWVQHKLKNKVKSKYLYAHMGIHLVALLVLLQFQHLGLIAIIVISHYVIDLAKLYLTKPSNQRFLFLLDQILHLGVIVGVVRMQVTYQVPWEEFLGEKTLLLSAFLVFVTYVSGILMRMLLLPYMKEINTDDAEEGGSLPNAGKYIGMLERLFVFGFICIGQWAAIGLLIAAKSVFRFGDLNKGNNRKLTEYVLIGTLLSFGLAMLSGLLYTQLSEGL
ncbi:MAG: DUF3307 domain-containing protein [Bacteroidota bacterium]